MRIPHVVEDICTRNVLAMEYLDGVSLSDAIEQEQDRVAKALGHQNGEELKKMLASRMRAHFKNGGGAGSGGLKMLGSKRMKTLNVFGPAAARVLRTYASVREGIESGIESAALHAAKFGSKL